jgi:acetyl esterase/lipase
MTATEPRNAPLGVVQPDFAPFVSRINEIFRRIWTPDDIDKLRRSFQSSRSAIPGVPCKGFEISHRTIQVSDGSDVELRIYRPTAIVSGQHAEGGQDAQRLPLLFVAHGGGEPALRYTVEMQC